MENTCLKLMLNDTIKRKIENKLDILNIDMNDYIENLIKKDVEAYIDFEEGFYYDINSNKLYSRSKNEIPFTRLERKLFSFLLLSRGAIVSIEEIKEKVWEGKEMSIFTLRNVIKKIRDKTYREIIKTYSNKGYELN